MYTLLLILWFALWYVPIKINIYIDRKGNKPHYAIVFGARGFAAFAHLIIFDLVFDYFPDQVAWSWGESWTMILMAVPILAFQITSFWILFELGLNKAQGKKPLYYDHQEGDSGIPDRIFKFLGPKAYLIAKILSLIVCIISIVVIISNLYE